MHFHTPLSNLLEAVRAAALEPRVGWGAPITARRTLTSPTTDACK